MPRFLVRRTLGHVTREQLDAAAKKAKAAREADFPDITWEHSHVVETEEGSVTYCVYEGPSEERIRAHAASADLPADAVWELRLDIDPEKL